MRALLNVQKDGLEGQAEGQSAEILNDLQSETLFIMKSMDIATQADLLAIARGLAKRPPE